MYKLFHLCRPQHYVNIWVPQKVWHWNYNALCKINVKLIIQIPV